FFKRKKLINNFLKGYFNNKIKNKDKKIIFFYLLIICTGSINYKNKKGIDYLEEINNLNYFLKNYSKILF
ncbi:MAG: hypothetical protein N2114_02520, partial [Candidatus Goldbacteria bacterium]|nr:hypothetical protein [Candidatus Goldiibacteriota bacterium]